MEDGKLDISDLVPIVTLIIEIVKNKDIFLEVNKTVIERHGSIDGLVNNVGDYRPLVRFIDSSPKSWKEMYDINLHHVFLVTHAFLQLMIDSGGGSIINIHSVGHNESSRILDFRVPAVLRPEHSVRDDFRVLSRILDRFGSELSSFGTIWIDSDQF